MKIILTVGHSILKTGACTSADGRPYGGVLEYAYNKKIVDRVAKALQSAGHTADALVCPELQFARSTDEKAYKLQRVNSGGYDLACELHLNASALHNARGCEVLYKSENGKKFAQRAQESLAKAFKSRGIQKRDNLYMLNSTKPTAILLESFFCDSSADCALAEQTDVALLIAEGIHGSPIPLGQEGLSGTAPSGMLYRVQMGAFTVPENAQRLKEDLQKEGVDAFITTADLGSLIYRVQSGAFETRAEADAMQQKLRSAGYEALVVA